MPSLNTIVRKILADLTPGEDRIQMAKYRGEHLIADLDRHSDRFSVRRIRPFGSVHRGTALAHFGDIDYLIPIDERQLSTRRGERRSPGHTIGELADWVEHCRAGVVAMGTARVRRQKHSVGLEYPGTNLRIDLVPALITRGRGRDIYLIPSREHGRWIKTRIDLIEGLVSSAPPRVLDAIRLLKGWKRARGPGRGFSLPSYAVELMLLRAGTPPHNTPPLTIAAGVLSSIAESDARYRLSLDGAPTQDPVAYRDPWTGENLLGANTRDGRGRLIDAARRTRDKLLEAADASERSAQTILSDLFIGRRWR